MQLSVEILEHIFSFLISHRATLVACSKDPILSPIAERYLYHHVVVQLIGTSDFDAFEPDYLSKLISEKPHILYHVRILEIRVEFNFIAEQGENEIVRTQLDKFAKTLLMFPMLQSIRLTPTRILVWYWPDVFRAALEDRLNLPTLTEVHLIGGRDFPSSILDNCKNIRNLTFSSIGSFEVTEGQVSDPTHPQLKSLTLALHSVSASLRAWLKRHISELQSLQCVYLPKEVLPELLGECSRTLNRLEIFLMGMLCSSNYLFRTGEIEIIHVPEFPSIPQKLQQLIIRAGAFVEDNDDHSPISCWSSLPAAAEVINLFIPSILHLVLDIKIEISIFSHFSRIDFSPLAVLGAASLSILRIDLFVRTGISPAALTRAQIVSSLEEYEDIMSSIEEGKLVIHSEITTPHLA